jgi:site-specific DNA-methyltransferase (adenine-specific)
MKSMPDESVDHILTDPPYGVLTGHKIETGIDIEKFTNECFRVLKKGGFYLFFGLQPTLSDWVCYARKAKFHFKYEFIWYKRQASCPFLPVAKVHENIEIFVKGSGEPNRIRRRCSDVYNALADYINKDGVLDLLKETEKMLSDPEVLKKAMEGKYEKRPAINNDPIYNSDTPLPTRLHAGYKQAKEGLRPQSLLSFIPFNRLHNTMRPEDNIKHPTVKSIELTEYLVQLISQPNQIVFDPFMGSGTTGIACKRTDRDFIGCELDKEYFDISNARLSKEEIIQTDMFSD